jgi:hypothetical protein
MAGAATSSVSIFLLLKQAKVFVTIFIKLTTGHFVSFIMFEH